MGITHEDVAGLNQAIAGVGSGFEQRRKDAIEQDMRQKMLDVEMRRMTAEEGRQATDAAGKVNADLEDEGGNRVGYSGPPQGYQSFVDGLKTKTGSDWSPVAPDQKKPLYAVKINLPDGEMTMYAKTPEELQTQVDQIRKNNKTVPKQPAASASRVQETAAADAERTKRAQLQAQLDELTQNAGDGGPLTQPPFNQDSSGRIASLNSAIEQSKANEAHLLGQDVPMDVGTEDIPGALPGQKAGTRKIFAPRGSVLNPPTPAASVTGPVLMKNKAGQVVKVPAAKVDWAKQNGYTPQ